jgi:isoleucyl-tRNA synthetase
LPGKREDSVFLSEFYANLFEMNSTGESIDAEAWTQIMVVRTEVSRALENLRKSGEIGSGLDAEVDLYCTESLFDLLNRVEDELRFVLITSYARIHPYSEAPAELEQSEIEGLKIEVSASAHNKCVRCWHHREDVGSNSEHPELCGRCIENVTADGEERHYA